MSDLIFYITRIYKNNKRVAKGHFHSIFDLYHYAVQ